MTRARTRVFSRRPSLPAEQHERASLYDRTFPPLLAAVARSARHVARDKASGRATSSVLAAQSAIQPRAARRRSAATGDRVLASGGFGRIARCDCRGQLPQQRLAKPVLQELCRPCADETISRGV